MLNKVCTEVDSNKQKETTTENKNLLQKKTDTKIRYKKKEKLKYLVRGVNAMPPQNAFKVAVEVFKEKRGERERGRERRRRTLQTRFIGLNYSCCAESA